MVPLAGLEPALLAELHFECSASTNFTTGACAFRFNTVNRTASGSPKRGARRLQSDFSIA